LNGLFLEYRDPLFGFFTIFLIIFIASFLTYAYNIYRERKARKSYRNFLNKFELGELQEEDYIHLYTTYNLPFDSIILLASSFIHKGEYNRAISVYISLLEHVKEPVKKEELLEHLGTTYFKSGFLQRSKNVFLKILQFSPRNKVALKHLFFIYEKLQDYKRCEDVLESLDEIDFDTTKDRFYISILKILDDPMMSYNQKTNQLINLFNKNKVVERSVIEYLVKYNKDYLWENIEKFDLIKVIDLMWYLDFNDIDFSKVEKNQFLSALYRAKGYIKGDEQSGIFELDVLISTKNSTLKVPLDLNFEFICKKCKKVHPIYNTRCPHCNSILTFKTRAKLAKGYYEENSSLQ
jgi:lipopolysaccharide biosynthesis regulator YciM